jgi:hypothetical protein
VKAIVSQWRSVLGHGLGGCGGNLGTLAATFIAGRLGLKQRKVEIYFSQKADAYAALFKAVHEVILASHDGTIYAGYLTAFERAKMFASCEVRRI